MFFIPRSDAISTRFSLTEALIVLSVLEFRVWIDPETTQVQFFGQRRQAGLTRSRTLKPGSDLEDEVIVPEEVDGPKPTLLEVADLYGYTALQVHSGRAGEAGRRYRGLYSLIDPYEIRWARRH